MPNILIEGMSSGLPLICSNRPPMPEFLLAGGFYFDPTDVISLEKAIYCFLKNGKLRADMVDLNLLNVKKYDWNRTTHSTFSFIQSILENVE
jgi:glycosyltransferase involved in cell wall biosynthesis